MKRYAASVGIVIKMKKNAIQLDKETPLPESLQDIRTSDETTYKYLSFEMMNGEVEIKEMMIIEERIIEELDELTKS